VAVICDGTTPREQVLTSTLGSVAGDCARQGLRPPAVVVIGEVVRLRELLRPALAQPQPLVPDSPGPRLTPSELSQPELSQPEPAGAR
jgi:hypothetical protein